MKIELIRVRFGEFGFRILPLAFTFWSVVGYPSGQRGQTVNLLAYAFDGSNPSPTTTSKTQIRTTILAHIHKVFIGLGEFRMVLFFAFAFSWLLLQNGA